MQHARTGITTDQDKETFRFMAFFGISQIHMNVSRPSEERVARKTYFEIYSSSIRAIG